MTNCIFEPRTDTSSATICKHCGQEKFLHIQLPQQEISDEEIEKAVNEYAEVYQCPTEISMCKHDVISAWNNGIKWYREQLKQRQNGK